MFNNKTQSNMNFLQNPPNFVNPLSRNIQNNQNNQSNQNRELKQGILSFNNQNQLPNDSIQAIEFSYINQNCFAMVSWDKTARLYTLNNGQVQQQKCVPLPDFPLDCIFLENNDLLVSCGDGCIYRISLANQNSNPQKLYQSKDNSIIFKMSYAPDIKLLMALTQKQLLLFSNSNFQNPVKFLNFQNHAVNMSLDLCDLIIAFANDQFTILEINSFGYMTDSCINYLSSNLRTNITTCSVNAKNKIYTLGSSDGRISRGIYKNEQKMSQNSMIIYACTSTENKNCSFIFVGQCEKVQNSKSKTFQITSTGFNPRSDGFFYTTGSNGQVNFWDVNKKNKIGYFNSPCSVTASGMNKQGNMLVVGLGYDWSKGINGFLQALNYHQTNF